jgi:hypothetical protein
MYFIVNFRLPNDADGLCIRLCRRLELGRRPKTLGPNSESFFPSSCFAILDGIYRFVVYEMCDRERVEGGNDRKRPKRCQTHRLGPRRVFFHLFFVFFYTN